MTERLHQLAARVYNTPLLIHPDKALVIESVLRRWAAGDAPKPAALLDGEGGAGDGRRRVYRVTPGGTALIPVVGTLVHRGAWIGAYSGMTSYQGLSRQLAEARADDAVRAVMLDIDSPGGEAAGMFELSRMVRAVDAEKPVWAVANEGAFSAAYGLAAGGSRILAPESAMAGSIGVIALHMDESEKRSVPVISHTSISVMRHFPVNGFICFICWLSGRSICVESSTQPPSGNSLHRSGQHAMAGGGGHEESRSLRTTTFSIPLCALGR